MKSLQRGKNDKLAALSREWIHNPSKRYPTGTVVIKTITSKPIPAPSEELPEELTTDDYDEWVYQALLDLARKPQRFHSCPDNEALIECPRRRLFRLGEEAQHEGKSSELYRYLMEITENGAKLPSATSRAMLKAQKYLNIAIAFKQFVAENGHKNKNFKDLKCRFREKRDLLRLHVSESTLERALRTYDLDWSAYAIDAPRKGKRNKSKNS
jgi:hypothetical protein